MTTVGVAAFSQGAMATPAAQGSEDVLDLAKRPEGQESCKCGSGRSESEPEPRNRPRATVAKKRNRSKSVTEGQRSLRSATGASRRPASGCR